MKTLLLGMGNPVLTDDAVGVRLAREIGRALRGVADLTVVEECSVGGLNLLEVLEGYDRAVLFDSLETTDGVPGRWHRFGAEALDATVHVLNIHDVNFATALELGRRLGVHLPDDITIFAVEVSDSRTFSERMTPELERAFPAVASAIRREVESILRA